MVVLTAAAFLAYFASYTVYFWFPTILKRQSGPSNMWIGILGAVPYTVCCHANRRMALGQETRKTLARRGPIIYCSSRIARSYLYAQFHPADDRIVQHGVSMAFLPTFWAIPTEILCESTAATAVGMINAIASIAGFAAPYAFGYLHSRTGSFSYGFAMLMVAALVGGILLPTPWARQREVTEVTS